MSCVFGQGDLRLYGLRRWALSPLGLGVQRQVRQRATSRSLANLLVPL